MCVPDQARSVPLGLLTPCLTVVFIKNIHQQNKDKNCHANPAFHNHSPFVIMKKHSRDSRATRVPHQTASKMVTAMQATVIFRKKFPRALRLLRVSSKSFILPSCQSIFPLSSPSHFCRGYHGHQLFMFFSFYMICLHILITYSGV